MRSSTGSEALRVAIACASLLAAVGISELLRPYLGREGPVLFLMLAVITSAYAAGFTAAVGVTLIAAAIVARSFITHSIHPSWLDEFIPPGVFTAISIGTSWFISSRKRAMKTVVEQNTQLEQLLSSEQAARSQLKSVADDLRESEHRFRIVAALTRDVLWELIPEANRLEWADGITRVFGYKPEQISTEPRWWQNLLHPDDRDRVLAGLAAALRSSVTEWSDEFRFRRADGGYAVVLNRARILRDTNGLPARIIGSMMDLSEQKRAEASLRESHRFLQRLLRSVPSPVLMLDAKGQVVLFNRACEQVSGYKRHELVGQSLAARLVHPEDAKELERRLADPLSPLACEPQTMRWITRSGDCQPITWHFTVVQGPQDATPFLLGAGVVASDPGSLSLVGSNGHG